MNALELEYTTLKNEIIKRIELRQQIVLATLTIAGVFLGFGVKENAGLVALVYPPLAMFLCIAWSHNENRVRAIARYICEKIEQPNSCLKYEQEQQISWEKMQKSMGQQSGIGARLRSIRVRASTLPSLKLAYGGILILTQVMAILIGSAPLISNWIKHSYIEQVLFLILISLDWIATVVVIAIFRSVKKYWLNPENWPDIKRTSDEDLTDDI